MTEQIVRRGAAATWELVLEIVIGAWLLVLFVVAMAWDPLDRRLGFHARRHVDRITPQRAPAHRAPMAGEGAYGIAAQAA